MCGIIGYTGRDNAVPYLINGLKRLEYRGYDSSGIAVSEKNDIRVIRSCGRISELERKLRDTGELNSNSGIGHTRWATHGEPSDINAHPHMSCGGLFAVVHNGIIENYPAIKNELIREGFCFSSQTDTEAAANLLEKNYRGDFLKAVLETSKKLCGSFALGIMCRDCEDTVIYTRRSSPLFIGEGNGEIIAASDMTAISEITERIYKLEDNETAVSEKEKLTFYDKNGKLIYKTPMKAKRFFGKAEKGIHEHFMMKEIREQPQVLRNAISPRIQDKGIPALDGIKMTSDDIKGIRKIYLVACGSAYHAGITGKYVIERLTRIPSQAETASEFRYRDPVLDRESLVILISQSGETADTLAALRLAKEKGARVISVVNTVGSSMDVESDDVLYTWAGPEIAVATTKAYSAQLAVMYILGIYIGEKNGTVKSDEGRHLLSELMRLPDTVQEILKLDEKMKKAAQMLKNAEHAYFIGRGIDYTAALEASLKMKEISYIHSESYAAGELKHGAIALIDRGTVVIGLACCDGVFEKTVSNLREVKARGAVIIAVTAKKHVSELSFCDEVIEVPETEELFYASAEAVPMQLLAYYTAKERGCDIDKPRNLAKSVTVE